MELEKFKGDTQQIWDPSSVELLEVCPFKYKMARLEGWRTKSRTEGIKPTWGKVIHACLDAYDATLFSGKSVDESINSAVRKLLQIRDIITPKDEEEKASWDNRRTVSTAARALIWYGERYRDDIMVVETLPDGKPAIEVRLEVSIPGTEKRMSGRLDRLVRYQSGTYILDRKTTDTTLDSSYFSRYLCNTQIYTYLWLLRQMGFPVQGFVVDAIQTLVSGTRFKRQVFDVSDELLEEFMGDVKYHIMEAHKYAETGDWPMRFSSCGMYGGCQFRKICSKSPSARSGMLEADFTKETEPNV